MVPITFSFCEKFSFFIIEILGMARVCINFKRLRLFRMGKIQFRDHMSIENKLKMIKDTNTLMSMREARNS